MARELNLRAGIQRVTRWLIKSAGLGVAAVALSVDAAQIDIPGPAGSGAFGATVTVLPNGNIVVTDPNGPVSNVGAVYLYGPTGVSLSSLTGSSANDQVGSGGVTVLRNGNYVVRSPNWNNGAAANVGAVTWANGGTGVSGVVSPTNSLVGTTTNDFVGSGGVTVLSNGNYVVLSPNWDSADRPRGGARRHDGLGPVPRRRRVPGQLLHHARSESFRRCVGRGRELRRRLGELPGRKQSRRLRPATASIPRLHDRNGPLELP